MLQRLVAVPPHRLCSAAPRPPASLAPCADKNNKREHRGFGFVTYDDEISVEKCLVMPHVLNGKAVEVKRAVGKDQSPGGGGMGEL